MFAQPRKGLAAHFTPRFMAAVPEAKVQGLFARYLAKAGPINAIETVAQHGPYRAEYRVFGQHGSFPLKLRVEAVPPHRIDGLWVGALLSSVRTLAEVSSRLKKLPGSVSFALWQLDGAKPRVLAQLGAERRLAIGSTFKLYILGALIEAVQRGKLQWRQTVRLSAHRRSFPSGVLQRWPLGAPVSLATLATQMISISDNTATDELLMFLGRKKVEAMIPKMSGAASDARNIPLLSTREMFLLKDDTQEARQRRTTYLASTVRQKRSQLATLGKLPITAFSGLSRTKPTALGRLEWFASATEICRAMDWLRRKTANKSSALGRAILGVNRGLTFRRDRWRFVGYKGGSEPGVLNLSWLLEDMKGRFYALSVGWNDPHAPLAEARLTKTMQALILLLERRGR